MKCETFHSGPLNVCVVFALLGCEHLASAHGTDVHASLSQSSIEASGVSLAPTDIDRAKEGSIHEDIELRYRDHHYNPHAGVGVALTYPSLSFYGKPAVETGRDRWLLMGEAFDYPVRRWNDDESVETQGSLHAMGRVLHLLQDMSSPPHTHAPRGHGWLGPIYDGPGGSSLGFYSDFECVWSPSNSEYLGWPIPTAVGGVLTPDEAINTAIQGSRLDATSLSEMRTRLGTIPTDERNTIEGYIKAQAWITHFHTSFYGQINYDENNPAPASSNTGRANILRQMYPKRIAFRGGLYDDYWTIDGVGYYDKKDGYFPNDWWPSPDEGSYPIGHKEEGSGDSKRILGRFYIYLHYFEGASSAPENRATPPDYWPDGSANSSGEELAQYYGQVLLPLSVRLGAGLLREVFPAPGFTVYPRSQSSVGSDNVAVALKWAAVSTDAGQTTAYQLQRARNGGSWVHVSTTAQRSFSESLSAGTYRYRVRSRWFDSSDPIWSAWCEGDEFEIRTSGATEISVRDLSLSPSTVEPYGTFSVSGSAVYGNGDPIVAGTAKVTIEGGDVYTAAVSEGTFVRSCQAPGNTNTVSISRTVAVRVIDGSANAGEASEVLTITGQGSVAYDLTTEVIHDFEDHGDGSVTWWSKDAFRTTDEWAGLFVLFKNMNLDHDLDVMWRLFDPTGDKIGEFEAPNEVQRSWESYWIVRWWYIEGYGIAFHPGKYRFEFYIDRSRKRTHFFVVGWDFKQHFLCIDYDDDWQPLGETNTFSPDDERVVALHHFEYRAQQLDTKTEFLDPDGSLRATFEGSFEDDLGPHEWWGSSRSASSLPINGSDPQFLCGEWTVKFYIKNPSNNGWEQKYTDHFLIREGQTPDASVSISPEAPTEEDEITFDISSFDNNHLDRVALHWDDGEEHAQVWNDINASSLSETFTIGRKPAGASIKFWVEAVDESGNEYESSRQTVLVDDVVGFVQAEESIPEEYFVSRNSPNPFNPSTGIRIGLPTQSLVTIRIYNSVGQIVDTPLVTEMLPAGIHSLDWDSSNREGGPLSAGVYLIHIRAEPAESGGSSFDATRRVVLVR